MSEFYGAYKAYLHKAIKKHQNNTTVNKAGVQRGQRLVEGNGHTVGWQWQADLRSLPVLSPLLYMWFHPGTFLLFLAR